MSLSVDIIQELSRQIALLQDELQRHVSATPIQKPKRLRPEPIMRTRLRQAIRSMETEHYNQLCKKYKDEIDFIQTKEPGWLPANRFFDVL